MNTSSTGTHALHLLVAGHTNTGKTSLIRTLGRTTEFGQVSSAPSTTRRIQPLVLIATGDLEVTVYDTPGLESSGRLRELLEREVSGRYDRPAVIEGLMRDTEIRQDFEQELRVLDQALKTDASLYVIDAREPVLEKYLDEIVILSMCGRPVVPLLNFTAWENSRESEWRTELAKLDQHTVVSFDAVVYSWESERRLYRSLATVMPAAEHALERLIRSREEQTGWRLDAALRALADALIDLAACEDAQPRGDADAIQAAARRVREYARERERHLAHDILSAFNYTPEILGERLHDDYRPDGWRRDAFDEATLEYYGIRSIGPLAAGAATGGMLDVVTLGGSLGIGTLLGAAAGLAYGARGIARRVYRSAVQQLETLVVDPSVIRLIATRNLELITTLQTRGHAEQRPADLAGHADRALFRDALPGQLLRASERPEWSSYRQDERAESLSGIAEREKVVQDLQTGLRQSLRSGRAASVTQAQRY